MAHHSKADAYHLGDRLLSKAIDGARLAEMVGLSKMFGKLSSIFPEVTINVFLLNWSDFRRYYASTIVSYASTELDFPK